MKKSSPKRKVEQIMNITKKYKSFADFMTNATEKEKEIVMKDTARRANLAQKKMVAPKRREVKAWAIVNVMNNEIENAAFFEEQECPAATVTDALAVYEKRNDALYLIGTSAYKVVPCTIIFSPPKKPKRLSK